MIDSFRSLPFAALSQAEGAWVVLCADGRGVCNLEHASQRRADPPAVKRGRGRPRVHASAAARQAAYRERHGFVTKTIELPAHVAEAFALYMHRHVRDGEALTESQVFAKLVERQLCRKR